MIAAVIAGKLVAGFAAVALALLLFGRSLPRAEDAPAPEAPEAAAEGV